MAVSLRLPEEVKERIARLAEAQDVTPHAFMLEAIREKVEAEEARLALHQEAQKRLRRMQRSGSGIPADEAFDYLERRARGERAARPKPRKLT
jgi:predicted DNA-binding protein